jgi:signal recognition particle subunit SRP54
VVARRADEVCMFEALNERLTGVFDRITGRGALSEKDVT